MLGSVGAGGGAISLGHPTAYFCIVRLLTRTQLQQLSPNPLRAPQAVVGSHVADQRDRPGVDPRLAVGAGLATPVKPKRIAVPPEESLGLDQTEGRGPCASATGETDQQPTVSEPQAWTLAPALEDQELMAEKRVLGNELPARSGHVRKGAAKAKRPDGFPNSPEESSGDPVEHAPEPGHGGAMPRAGRGVVNMARNRPKSLADEPSSQHGRCSDSREIETHPLWPPPSAVSR